MYCLEQFVSGADVACGLDGAVLVTGKDFSSLYNARILEIYPSSYPVVTGASFLWLKLS
jgi:hypothetical protein